MKMQALGTDTCLPNFRVFKSKEKVYNNEKKKKKNLKKCIPVI